MATLTEKPNIYLSERERDLLVRLFEWYTEPLPDDEATEIEVRPIHRLQSLGYNHLEIDKTLLRLILLKFKPMINKTKKSKTKQTGNATRIIKNSVETSNVKTGKSKVKKGKEKDGKSERKSDSKNSKRK